MMRMEEDEGREEDGKGEGRGVWRREGGGGGLMRRRGLTH